ncbi:hypothetical protein N8I86_24660 [Streptomyces albidocamelliae]|uniref:Peptidoglycan binding domain-containing protein n=1 Tax=Streptomyces albidocamelliae TaxID=2981135 RepID=A0ABY6ETG6_9ACTN|nr:hypothetical protein [Streptomyces sp. HUAS 14-6]UXY37642.1 hypothetical protein N8I86_24660 [Streptomyces sp. HUAS 14-6]
MASDDGTDTGRSGARSEEKKTETTLTTRIRINIPGSRPIPPVVVRKPVGDADGAVEEAPAAEPRPRGRAAGAPRRRGPRGARVPAPGRGRGEDQRLVRAPQVLRRQGRSGRRRHERGRDARRFRRRTRDPGRPRRAGGPSGWSRSVRRGRYHRRAPERRPSRRCRRLHERAGRPRPGATNGKGLPGATGGPVAPGHGGGTGSFDVTEALAAGSRGGGPRPGASGAGEPRRDDLPYFAENGADALDGTGTHGQDGFGGAGAGGGNGHGGPGGPSGYSGPGGPGGHGGPQGPAGPTGGPVTGDGTLLPPPVGPFGLERGEPFDGPAAPPGTGGYGGPGGRNTPPARSALADIADLSGPGAPGAGPAGRGPGGGLSDDTAILTPQKPAPEPAGPGFRAPVADNVSGHTVTSGIPVVPGPGTPPFGSAAHTGGPGPRTASEPAPAAAPKATPKPKKKGRSKLVLLGAVVVVLAGGAYGAGLLMNRTDVPKGTTVLGVDIGGGTRDDAVKKLDDAFGSRVNKPLKLAVGGRTVTLTPENAGLQFDYQATVSEAAKSDYNPVHVVGSLFGQKRVVEPVMPVDEEKLQAALQQAGGGSGAGSVTDGTIEFRSGKAVAVYGKPGKAVDAARSGQAVEQAYRTLVETGTPTPVGVPTTTRQPTVSNAEVDRMMKDFANPAMSGKVTVQTDAAHSVPLSPENSLWKFLRVTAVNGKLVDKPDLKALQQLYGQTFDGVLIARGNGKKTPVTPNDVYLALRQALTSRTNRVAVIETDPS